MRNRINSEILSKFLVAGGWKAGGREDLSLREQIPYDFAKQIIHDFRRDSTDPSATSHLGLLSLALGVSHWGVSDIPEQLSDPQNDNWRGPPSGRGKHLMSVTAGGVGLPHMDVGYLADFLQKFAGIVDADGKHPTIHDTIALLRHGGTFASLRTQQGTEAGRAKWRDFIVVAEAALATEEGQRWVLEQWLDRYWTPSFDAVRGQNRSVEEAIVNARIRNSRTDTAKCALEKAKDAADPIETQLAAYVSGCPGSKADHRRRVGYMMRPVELYRFIS